MQRTKKLQYEYLLVLVAVLFNFILAFINGSILPVTAREVIAAEIAIVALALLAALAKFDNKMVPWLSFAYIFLIIAIVRSIVLTELQLKPLRDMLIIATFVMLGLAAGTSQLKKAVLALNLVVVIVLIFEAYSTEAYSALVNVKSYYINTRGFDSEDFFNEESNLFVSATRPNERFFSFIDLHRMSSVFLEPPSLGNFSIILAAYTIANSRQLSGLELIQLIAGIVITLLASDSRLATVTIGVLLVLRVSMLSSIRVLSACYFWLALFAAFIAVLFLGWDAVADNFEGRTVRAVQQLMRFDLADVLGISNTIPTLDSGHEYLVLTQSVFGLLLFWAYLSFASKPASIEAIRFHHYLWIYISFNLIVAASALSIKTAALLWFAYGALLSEGCRTLSRERKGNVCSAT